MGNNVNRSFNEGKRDLLKEFDEVSHTLFTGVLLLKGVSHSSGRYKALNY